MVQPQLRSAVAQIRREKEQLRKRIEHDPQLKKDFEFLINKTGLTSRQLLTGLWLDCNMMKADRQTLLNKAKQEIWTISEDSLRRTIKRIGRVAREVAAADRTNFLPLGTEKLATILRIFPRCFTHTRLNCSDGSMSGLPTGRGRERAYQVWFFQQGRTQCMSASDLRREAITRRVCCGC